MTEQHPIPWKRVAIEGPAIVVSILLAFAIQAWWDDRNEREAERWLLDRLLADFRVIRDDLAVVKEDHQRTFDASIALLQLPTSEMPITLTNEIAADVGQVFLVARTFNPGSGSVNAFLNNEMSTQFENQPLADLLIRWSAQVDELQEEEAQMQKGVSERWTPFLASRIDIAPILHLTNPIFSELPQEDRQLPDDAELLFDTQFRNHVVDRYKWQMIALRDLAPLETTVDEVLRHLQRELD